MAKRDHYLIDRGPTFERVDITDRKAGMTSTPILSKIKAIAVGAVLVAATAVAQHLLDVDYTSFGVFGPTIGLAVAAVIGYMKREKSIENLLRVSK